MVEAAGIEPASGKAPRKASTGLGRVLSLAQKFAPNRAFLGQPAKVLPWQTRAFAKASPINFIQRKYQASILWIRCLIKQRMRIRNRYWQLQVCRFLRGQRRLDLQLWLLRPRRNQGAPTLLWLYYKRK